MSETTLRFAARSHIGKVRRNNEDSGYASSHLIMVADGMGGHEAGELASAATVGAVVSAVSPSDEVDQALTLLGEEPRGAAGREQREPVLADEGGGEFRQAAFVGDGEKGESGHRRD